MAARKPPLTIWRGRIGPGESAESGYLAPPHLSFPLVASEIDSLFLYMGRIGRNQPCPCGSGKKYKNCCLKDGAPTPRLTSLTEEIAAFALEAAGKAELQAAWEEHGEAGPVKEGPRFGLFLDWLITGRRRGGRTLLERFEAERAEDLSASDRSELAKHKSTAVTIVEVLEVRPGTGLAVQDLFSGEKFDVADVSSSRQAAVWDVLGMRLRRQGGPAEAWGEAVVFSPLERLELKFEVEGAYRMAKVHEPGLSWQAFLNSAPPLLRRLQAAFRGRRRAVVKAEDTAAADPRSALAGALQERERRWPDEPVPALGGRTPRQAAGNSEGRRFLADLLKEYESSLARAPDALSGSLNIPSIIWMREALGLPVPAELADRARRLVEALGASKAPKKRRRGGPRRGT